MSWETREQAAKHYGCSLSSIDRLRKLGIIGSSKIRKLGIWVELIPKEKLAQRHLLYSPEVVVTLPKKKQKLDISLAEYDRKYLKGDSAVANKKQRWSFGKKGVFKRKLKSGYSWCYWIYDENKELKKVTVPDATSREDAINAMEAELREIRNQQNVSKQITFRMFAPIYMDKYAKQKKDSWKTDEKFINNRLIPYFGDMLLSEISPKEVSEFIAQFKPKKKDLKEIKGSTINKHLQVLSRMISLAEKFGYIIGKNPVSRELHFAKETKYVRTRVLSVDEEDRLMAEAAPHLRTVIQCALLQAMRLKEILQLLISDVDLDAETVTIRPENNKTGKLDVIPIRSKMLAIFARQIAENDGRSPFMFNYEDPKTGELRPIRTCQHSFEGARRRAKIEGLEFRDLRRTCATRLYEAGVDPLIVSRLLRHSSAKISTEVYIQSNMKLMQKAMKEADQEPGKSHSSLPNFRPFRTYLEHGQDSTKSGKEVTCLFSRN